MIKSKKYTCAAGLFILVAFISTTSSEENVVSNIVYESVDWDILRQINKNRLGNEVYSPFSLKLLLSILYEGANVDTATSRSFQDSAFHFPKNLTVQREKYKSLLEALKSVPNQHELDVNTKMYLNDMFKLQSTYQERIKKIYESESETTNFTDSVNAASSINEWISKTTRGKLTELVNADEIRDAAMLLLNTMFFKGTWQMPFNVTNTKEGGFYLDKEKLVNVDYMENLGEYEYFEHPTLDAKFLKIPFKGEDLSMSILLPNSKSGLNKLISAVSPQVLDLLKYLPDKVQVHVILPKFNFQSKIKFNDILKTVGLRKIFDNSASFGRIMDVTSNRTGQGVFVSGILQKSGIEINEEGSTAYTATGVELSNKFGTPEFIFNASNPFLFWIEHEKKNTNTNTVLFVGQVVNPAEGLASLDAIQNQRPSETSNRFGQPTESTGKQKTKRPRCRYRIVHNSPTQIYGCHGNK